VLSRVDRGFTLLEVLVVLALVGLMSALALPQFAVIRDRLEFSLSRESFEHELSGLGYRALTEGRPFILSGAYPRDPNAEASPWMSDNPLAAVVEEPLERGQYRTQAPINANDAPLNLPAKWKLVADKPVVYQVSGFCSGGEVTLTVGGQRYVYNLKAPACLVELGK
jgi:prepilin-type N-terminal cleavage/methylation domain-containing protein